MPFCIECGTENPAQARFCLACGTPLASAPAPTPPSEERKIITAIFVDLVGSTARSEQLDPEDVKALVAPYHARVRAELERHGGTFEKFSGDAILALFGSPKAHEDDPERSVRAGLAVRNAIAELNAEDQWLDLHIRIGIHTGEALVMLGARPSEGEWSAAGDVLNTAARIQSAAPTDGILVGEQTYLATKHAFEFRDAEPLQAKGKAEPVHVWEVVAEQDAVAARPRAEQQLIGRLEELEELSTFCNASLEEPHVGVATILGSPGIGKSRLLLELVRRLEERCDVHWGRCLSYGEGITYWPVQEIVEDAAGILRQDDAEGKAAKLAALLESLGTTDKDELRSIAAAISNLIGASTTPLGTYSAVEIGQTELHWGIRRLLELRAEQRPTAIVIEDLHWAEPTLLELLAFIGQSAALAPLLILGTARPEARETGSPLFVSERRRRALELDALSSKDSVMLIAELVPAGIQVPVDRLLEVAGGNPLFLEETVRMVADRALDPELPPGALPVPDNLQALIGSRLDALPSGDKRVAQQASVVGGVFWQGAVSHLDGSGGDLAGSLATLERRDFVQAHPESAIAEDREYAFKHILIRDVAYDRLPKGRRAELHVRFTDWLSGVPGPEGEFLEIVAYHLEQACQLAGQIARSPIEPPILDAAAALAGAAEKAQRREGLREAGRYYDRALALLGDRFPERSLELRLARARTRTYLGELQQASEDLAETAEDALSLERPDLRCRALVTLGNIDHRQSRPSQARRRLTEAQALAVESGDRSLQVHATFGLAAVRADHEGEAEAAVEELRRALSVAEEMDDRALRVEGHLRLGFLLFNMGEIGASERELLRCTELAGELGSIRDEARAAFLLGLVKHYRGEPDEAARLSLQARDWLERTGEPYFQMQNFRALGLYALARGDLDAAELRLREAIPVAVEEGGREVLEVYRFLTETLVRQERIPDAVTLVEFASRNVPEEDLAAQAHLLLARAAIAAAQGDRGAFALYARAINWLEEQFLPIEASEARITFASALRRLGELDDARAQLTIARETFERMGASGPCAQVDGELERIESGAG